MHMNASKCLAGAGDLGLRDGPSCLISLAGHKASSFPVTNLSAANPRPPIPLATIVRDFLCQIPTEMAGLLGQLMVPSITNHSFLPGVAGHLKRGEKLVTEVHAQQAWK